MWISKIGMLIERQEAIPHDRCSWDEMNIQETTAMPARTGMSSVQYNWMQNPWMYQSDTEDPMLDPNVNAWMDQGFRCGMTQATDGADAQLRMLF